MVTACLQIARSGSSPLLGIRPGLRRNEFSALTGGVRPLRCCRREDNASSTGEGNRPESLFIKELKRRGMTPTPLTEDSASSRDMLSGPVEEMEMEEELDGGGSGSGRRGSAKRNSVASVDYDKDLANQRERSMSLNSEGLEELGTRLAYLRQAGKGDERSIFESLKIGSASECYTT